MRLVTFTAILIFGLSCSGTKHAIIKSSKLNGTWIPVKQEIGGISLPKPAFEKQKLILSDSNYTFIAESTDKGVIKFGDGKMDIYGREGVNTGKHFTAIYKYENGEFTVCYNLLGDRYPEAFETKGKPSLFLSATCSGHIV